MKIERHLVSRKFKVVQVYQLIKTVLDRTYDPANTLGNKYLIELIKKMFDGRGRVLRFNIFFNHLKTIVKVLEAFHRKSSSISLRLFFLSRHSRSNN